MGYYLSLSKFSKHEEHSRKYFAKSLYIPVILHGTYDFILMINIKVLLIVFVGFVLYLWKTNLDRLDQYVEDSRIQNERK
jgi:RsiW-degrading membrane proteinase PrsW (M82 family)